MQCFEYGSCYSFDLRSGEPLRFRMHLKITVEVFQHKYRRIQVFQFVDKWAQGRCLGLKPSQYLGFVMKSPVTTGALDNDLLFSRVTTRLRLVQTYRGVSQQIILQSYENRAMNLLRDCVCISSGFQNLADFQYRSHKVFPQLASFGSFSPPTLVEVVTARRIDMWTCFYSDMKRSEHDRSNRMEEIPSRDVSSPQIRWRLRVSGQLFQPSQFYKFYKRRLRA